MAPRQPNAKAVAAKEKKNAHQAAKIAEASRHQEKQTEEDWARGSNSRKAAKDEDQAQKADDAARKRSEKAELLAVEEANAGSSSGKVKSAIATSISKKNKNKKNDELSLLEGSLIEQADKQTKAKKRADRLKAEQEQQRENNAARHNFPGSGSNGGTRDGDDPLLANTSAMLRGVSDYDDTDNGRNDLLVGRKANVAAGVDGATGSGIDSALNALSMGGNKCGGAAEDDLHPEKRMKALHKAYEERMMPQMKMEYPGLRLAQYKEKIFHMWRKSPENPMNWPKKP